MSYNERLGQSHSTSMSWIPAWPLRKPLMFLCDHGRLTRLPRTELEREQLVYILPSCSSELNMRLEARRSEVSLLGYVCTVRG